MQTLTIFILTIAFGAVAVFFALKARRYAIKESKVPLKLHAYAIMAFCIGCILLVICLLHTMGIQWSCCLNQSPMLSYWRHSYCSTILRTKL